MANYMYLFRGGTPSSSPEAMQKQMAKWQSWIGQLSQQGNFKSGEPLDRSGRVVRGNKKAVTDGPYAESKDVVGGYLVVTANSYEHAVELSRGCPIFEHEDGSVEVRAIQQM
jgi:hypothetical protein